MFIHELAKNTGVPTKTIRYYESIRLLPPAQRAANNYRQYTPAIEGRLRFIASARALGFSLDETGEILATRDNGIAPCQRVLNAIGERLNDIDRRIEGLLTLREALKQLQTDGVVLPLDDVRGEGCICDLLTSYRDAGHVTIQKGKIFDDG